MAAKKKVMAKAKTTKKKSSTLHRTKSAKVGPARKSKRAKGPKTFETVTLSPPSLTRRNKFDITRAADRHSLEEGLKSGAVNVSKGDRDLIRTRMKNQKWSSDAANNKTIYELPVGGKQRRAEDAADAQAEAEKKQTALRRRRAAQAKRRVANGKASKKKKK